MRCSTPSTATAPAPSTRTTSWPPPAAPKKLPKIDPPPAAPTARARRPRSAPRPARPPPPPRRRRRRRCRPSAMPTWRPAPSRQRRQRGPPFFSRRSWSVPTANAEELCRSEGGLKTRLTRDLSDATLRLDLPPRRSPSACPEKVAKNISAGALPPKMPARASFFSQHEHLGACPTANAEGPAADPRGTLKTRLITNMLP